MKGRAALWGRVVLGLALTASLHPQIKTPPGSKIVELERRIASARGPEKIALLVRLSEARLFKDPAGALRDAQAARDTAVQAALAFEAADARASVAGAHIELNEAEPARREIAAVAGLADRWAASPPPGVPAAEVRNFLVKMKFVQGELELKKQNFAGARLLFQKALDAVRAPGTEVTAVSRVRLMQKTGGAYFFQADIKDALELFLDALRESQRTKDESGRIKSLYLVGYAYRDLKNYDNASRYFQESLEAARAAGDTQNTILALNEISNLLIFRNKPKDALKPKQEALKLAEQSGNEYAIAVCLHDMGVYFVNINEPEKALPYFERSLVLDERLGDSREMAVVLNSMADVLLGQGQAQEAIARHRRAEALAEKSGLKSELLLSRLGLARAYESLGLYKQAVAALNKAYALREILHNEESARQIAEIQAREENAARDKENERLRDENQFKQNRLVRDRWVGLFLVLAVGLAVTAAGLAFNRSRIKSKANRALRKAHEDIRYRDEQLEAANDRLTRLARSDSLTELDNRREMEDRLAEESIRFERTGRTFALIMIDIDKFKSINDRFGHEAGDAALRACAAAFRRTLRAVDAVARWGGDEFLALLPETDVEGARTAAAKLREAAALVALPVAGGTISLSLSTGVAEARPGRTVDAVVAEADKDMYRSRGRID